MNLEEFRQRALKVTVKTLCEHCDKLTESTVTKREVLDMRTENSVIKYTMISCWPCYAREYTRVNRTVESVNDGSEQ